MVSYGVRTSGMRIAKLASMSPAFCEVTSKPTCPGDAANEIQELIAKTIVASCIPEAASIRNLADTRAFEAVLTSALVQTNGLAS
jgi:hypothetical protein